MVTKKGNDKAAPKTFLYIKIANTIKLEPKKNINRTQTISWVLNFRSHKKEIGLCCYHIYIRI